MNRLIFNGTAIRTQSSLSGRSHFRQRAVLASPGFLVGILLAFSSASAATIDANCFKYTPLQNQPRPNCLEITLGNSNKFAGDPTNMFRANNGTMSAGFPNRDGNGTVKATLSGATMPDGQEVCVKFMTTGNKPSPSGQFTFTDPGPPQKPTVNVGNVVKSKSLDGVNVAYVPSGGGYDVTVNVANEFGSMLTGSVNVYVNTGFSSFFNLDDFDTLHPGAQLIASMPNYSLSHGQGLPTIMTHLNSAEEYILIVGTANADDGFGDSPFSYADSPVVIPEPLSITIFGFAIPFLLPKKR